MADGLETLSPSVRAFLARINREFDELPAGTRVPRRPIRPRPSNSAAVKHP